MTPNEIKTYRSLVLLNEIINGERAYSNKLKGADAVLGPLFVDLLNKGYLTIIADNFIATDEGQAVMNTFMSRYDEFLKVYDIYAFVDLEKKEMAFERYFDFADDEDWNRYKMDPRFTDMRIAVALFKKLTPSEIVFMSFLNENRFDSSVPGWQEKLLSSEIWNEIDRIIDTAIKPEEIGEARMKEILNQGSDIMMNLIETEKAAKIAENELITETKTEMVTVTEEIEETVTTVNYYQSYYYDPYFISPYWVAPLFIW